MSESLRILVLSASVGAGHLRAAQAVELALREVAPQATVQNMDVLDLTNATFRRFYGKAYLDLVNRAPHVLGYFYDLLDKPSRNGRHRGDRLRLAIEKINLRRLIRFLKDGRWDLVINTHFLPAEIIAALRAKGELNVPQTTVTTDFETHRLWVNHPCDRYFTATCEGAEYLAHWGVPRETIAITGIPIHPVFSKPKDRGDCLRRHGLAGTLPIVVQMAGGFGVGPVAKLFRELLAVDQPLQLVAVAGKNVAVREQLASAAVPPRHRVKVLGFTDQIDELLVVADLVVSKPGGLTTSETLARGAVMVIVNPTPGQESRNSDFLLENGAAIKVNNLGILRCKVSQLLQDTDRLKQMKANVAKLARPRAAYDVAEQSLKLLAKRGARV
jgi:processive 1,2-diacylglycerol beta-glucosyltransferase